MLTPICVFLLVAFQLVLIFLREVGCSRYIFYSDSAYFFFFVVVVVGGKKDFFLLVKTLSVLQNITFLAKEIEKVYSGFLKKGSV